MRWSIVGGALFAAVFAGNVGAQTLCENPAKFCGRFVTSECLQRLGAGARESPSEKCQEQMSTYGECVASAVDCARPDDGADRSGQVQGAEGRCDAQTARELWDLAEAENDCAGYEAYLLECGQRPRARFARIRLGKLTCAGYEPAPVDNADAPSRVETVLAAGARRADCAPDFDAAQLLPPAPVAAGAVFEADLAAGRNVLYCPVSVAALTEVSASLTGMIADVDLELLDTRTTEGEITPVTASVAAGSAPEQITTLLQPGVYMMRVYSADDQPSPFRLAIDRLASGADISDAYAPNSEQTAYDLATPAVGGAPVEVNDAILGGSGDYFAVTLDAPALMEVRLEGLDADLDVELRDPGGALVASGVRAEARPERLLYAAAPGRYTLRVLPATTGVVSRYHLSVALRQEQREDLGALAAGGSVTRSGALALEQPLAVYDFSLDALRPVVLDLDGLSNDVDLTLRAADGRVLGSSAQGGAGAERIGTLLPAGAYQAVAQLYAEDSGSPFTLTVAAQSGEDLVDRYPANSLFDAHDLGEVAVGGDAVGVSDLLLGAGEADVFGFTVSADALLQAGLDGLDADLDLFVLNEAGDRVGESLSLGVEPEQVRAAVRPGQYLARVAAAGDTEASRYTLTLLARSLTREDLGPLAAGATLTRSGALSAEAPVAYYDFTLDAEADVTLRLDEMTLDVDLTVLDASGAEIGGSANGGAEPELFQTRLAPGAYVARTTLYDSGDGPYRLSVSRR